MRLLIMFCIGVAVTLAWQSYGNAAREMIANSYPQLSWLAPQPAIAKSVPDAVAPTTSSSDPQELRAISADLATVRHKVQLFIDHEQMARDFSTKLQAAEQNILDKISAPSPQPAAAPARKPPFPR